MRFVTVFVFVFVATLLVSFRAEAADIVLPVDDGFAAIVAGEAPSPKRPRGTLLVFHVGGSGAAGSREAAAFEWDVARARAVSRKRLGSLADVVSVVRAVRAGSRIFVVFGSADADAAVVLMRVTPELALEAREEIGEGTMPSIDADAQSGTVATAFFEERPATSQPSGRSIVLAPPTKILNVQTRDAASLRRIAARYFAGTDGMLLSPHGMPGLAARAVAIHDGRVVLALPLRGATRIVTAGLRQLVVEGAREVARKYEPFGSMALVHASGGIVALGAGRPVEVAGRPSLPAPLARMFEDSDDAVLAWQTVHRLTHDLDGKTLLETSAVGPDARAVSPGSPRLQERR